MPLVLVHNDVVRNPAHAWDDVEGERYHYPSKYQGKVSTGEPFVYYRGVLRADGSRGPAEYVGAGRIGAIWVDPDRPEGSRKAWYCAVESYRRFAVPVPAKTDGVLLEDIPTNMWRDGIRVLPQPTYDRIIKLASEQPELEAVAPSPSAVLISTSETLILPPRPSATTRVSTKSGYRRSRQAKVVGDWAERIVMRYLQEEVADCGELVHRAAGNETPGWDIDYRDGAGRLQRIEVKGTISGGFSGVELTSGEMRAAKVHGDAYWLYLVSCCLTDRPFVQAVQNPAANIESGAWRAAASIFAVSFSP